MPTFDAGGTAGATPGSIAGMKLSVSLPDEDVAFVDEYAHRLGTSSRSSVLQHAIGLLRAAELETDYTLAFEEWSESDDAALWEPASADGLDAAR